MPGLFDRFQGVRNARCLFVLPIGSDVRRFALRGHVLDLAIGIVIGSAFISVVHSLVNDVISPPLGLLLGGVDFASLTIKMRNFVYKDQPPNILSMNYAIRLACAVKVDVHTRTRDISCHFPMQWITLV